MRGAYLTSVTGALDVHCQVCGLKYDLVDNDLRPGFASVQLTWGPNTYEGKFNESLIQGYAIFQVDADRGQTCSAGSKQHANDLKHVELNSSLVPMIPKRSNQSGVAEDGSQAGCSTCANVYSKSISWQLPSGVSSVRLMVSPVTDKGEVLHLGLTTGIVIDKSPAPTPAQPSPLPAPPPATTPAKRIVGKIVMTVADVDAFIKDPKVKQGLQNSIATTAGVQASYVTVILTAGRRLRGPQDEPEKRRLAAGAVNVDYTINIPAGAAVSAANVQNAMATVTPAAFQAVVNGELQKLGSTQVVQGVQSITAKEVAVGGATRSIATDDDDDDGLSGGAIAGIVIGVLLGVCCIAAVVGGGIWYHMKQQSGPQEIDVQPREVAVLPQQQQPQQTRVVPVSAGEMPAIPGVPTD